MSGDRVQGRVFGEVAQEYERTRPSYPAKLIDAVLTFADGARRALDVGAGTGKATALFGARGLGITAVEPDSAMASVLSQRCAELADVQVVVSTFEDYRPTERFDLLYSAQAWHWTDVEQRWTLAADALAPGGSIALFWNLDRIPDQALQEAVDAAHRRHTPGVIWNNAGVDDATVLDRWPGPELLAQSAFTDVATRVFHWDRTLTRADYLTFLTTHSTYRMLEPAPFDALLARLASVLPERVDVLIDTVLYLARRAT